MKELRKSMKDFTMVKDKIRRGSFMKIVSKKNSSFAESQLNQAFDMVDEDGSGAIDREEFEKWTRDGIVDAEVGISIYILYICLFTNYYCIGIY